MKRTHPLLPVFVLASLVPVLVACDRADSPQAAGDAKTGAETDARAEHPAAADPALADLPPIDPSALTDELRLRLEAGRAELQRRLAAATDDGERAAAWGDFGEMAHSYGMLQLAVPSYLRALELSPDSPDRTTEGGTPPWHWDYLLAALRQEAGDNEEAKERLTRLAERHPDDSAVLLRLAQLHLNEQPETSRTLYQRVLELGENQASAHFGLGRLAAAAGRHREAIDHWQRALELQPEAKNIHSLLAASYRRVGDEESSRYHSERFGTGFVAMDDPILERMNRQATGLGQHIEAALQAVQNEDWQGAVDAYGSALEIDPMNPAALRGKAFAYRMLRDPAAAESMYRLFLELHPSHILGRFELATLLAESSTADDGKLEEAIEIFQVLLQEDPDFEKAYSNLGFAWSRLGRWDRAAKAYEQALDLNPNDPQTRYRLAVAQSQIGRPSDAIATLRSLVADVPIHVPAHQRLGDLLEQAGDIEGAASMYRRVLEIEGVPPEEQALAHYQLGRLSSVAGGPTFDPAAAFRHFERAVELFPRLWQARFALGRRLAEARRWQDAADQYGAIVADQPTQVEPRMLEAQARMRAGQWQRAGDVLARGLKIAPKSAQLGHLMARLLAVAPEGIRDPERALPLAQSIFEAQPTNLHTETLIMALAARGRFEEAVQWQEKLVAKAEAEGDAEGDRDFLPRLRANLKRYRQGLPATLDS